MGDCDLCTGETVLSVTCDGCDGTFCGYHQLPEKHHCAALEPDESPVAATASTETETEAIPGAVDGGDEPRAHDPGQGAVSTVEKDVSDANGAGDGVDATDERSGGDDGASDPMGESDASGTETAGRAAAAPDAGRVDAPPEPGTVDAEGDESDGAADEEAAERAETDGNADRGFLSRVLSVFR